MRGVLGNAVPQVPVFSDVINQALHPAESASAASAASAGEARTPAPAPTEADLAAAPGEGEQTTEPVSVESLRTEQAEEPASKEATSQDATEA